LRLRIPWEERKRLLRREAWIAAVSVQVVLGAAWLTPVDGLGDSREALGLFCAAMVTRILTWHLGLLVWVIWLISLATRQWRLVAASTPLGVLFLVITVGAFLPAHPPSSAGASIKVMSVNLLMVNRATAPTIAEIERESPDVIAFQEVSPHWQKALEASLGGRYPYRLQEVRDDSFGAALYSRLPLANSTTELPLGNGNDPDLGTIEVPSIRAEIQHEGGTWVVYNVHTLPPRLLSYIRVQRRQFRDLSAFLQRETLPTLVTGDFNWTQFTSYHTGMRELGFVDAHAQAGRGLGATWPAIGPLRFVPGIRLDHLYLRGLVCTSCATGAALGSDHRAVIATVGRPR
jgi:endonuclease/exonuclease/phosphatase (EEP) superfamily protein YafD